ncbi:hypothetical protein [Paenibacillus foliorum]|nr:hypothetical protein [Paenibacillus foliorum]
METLINSWFIHFVVSIPEFAVTLDGVWRDDLTSRRASGIGRV